MSSIVMRTTCSVSTGSFFAKGRQVRFLRPRNLPNSTAKSASIVIEDNSVESQLLTVQNFCIALAIGAASGAIGAFIILKRMALVGDALSHVALPGIALALSYRLDPLWGVATCLLAAALLLWWLESKSKLPIDALVG